MRRAARVGIRVRPTGCLNWHEAAAVLGVSVHTIRRWASQGRIPSPSYDDGHVCYDRDTLDAIRRTGPSDPGTYEYRHSPYRFGGSNHPPKPIPYAVADPTPPAGSAGDPPVKPTRRRVGKGGHK